MFDLVREILITAMLSCLIINLADGHNLPLLDSKAYEYINRTKIVQFEYATPYATVKRDSVTKFKNTIYISWLGYSPIASINYEREIIQKEKYNIALEVGSFYGYRGINVEPIMGTSLNIHQILNHERTDHVQQGFGLVFMKGVNSCSDCYVKEGNTWVQGSTSSTLYISGELGYSRRHSTGGLFIKITVSPMLELYEFNNNPAEEITDLINKRDFLLFFKIGLGYSWN